MIKYRWCRARRNNCRKIQRVLVIFVCLSMILPKWLVRVNGLTTIENVDDFTNLRTYRKIVIIIAYMRTGSTFTASIFREYPGTFYVFEPIREVTNAFMEGEGQTYTTIKYLHGKEKKYTSEDRQNVVENDVNAWLTCDLKSLSLLSLTDESNKIQNTRITNELYSCMYDSMQNGTSDTFTYDRLQQHKNVLYERLQQPNIDPGKLDSCLDDAITACKESSVTVIKFVRLRMKNVGMLLRKYPNMKVIHLVRDPRGIINSRIRIHRDNDPESLCRYLLDDLIASESLRKRYPERLKIIRYEDIAQNPVKTAEELARFTNLMFTEPIYNFVREQTLSVKDSGPYEIQRRNSILTAQKWRLEISLQNARFVYNKCKASNDFLGYRPLDTLNELRDLRKPSMNHI